MPSTRTPRIRARLAGPSGLAAALVLGAAGPASASVHRAAVAGPGPGWVSNAATTDSPLNAMAVLGACGVAGFVLLVLGRRKTDDEPAPAAPPSMTPPPDLEALMASARAGARSARRPAGSAGSRSGTFPKATTTGAGGVPAPIWVKRLNDQAPPPTEPTRVTDGAYRG